MYYSRFVTFPQFKMLNLCITRDVSRSGISFTYHKHFLLFFAIHILRYCFFQIQILFLLFDSIVFGKIKMTVFSLLDTFIITVIIFFRLQGQIKVESGKRKFYISSSV